MAGAWLSRDGEETVKDWLEMLLGIIVLQLTTECEQDTADKLGSRCLAAVDAQESARTLLTRESSSF